LHNVWIPSGFLLFFFIHSHGQIYIIASEEKMIAYGHPFPARIELGQKTEIRGSPSYVNYKNRFGIQFLFFLVIHPIVESRLGLFQKDGILHSRQMGGLYTQTFGMFVKRGWNGYDHRRF